MGSRPAGTGHEQRRSNRRLALVLGLVALGFYLFIVVVKPMSGT